MRRETSSSAAPVLGRRLKALLAATAGVLAIAASPGSLPARAQGTGSQGQDPCADLGSFAVVDPPPLPRGQPLTAQPYQPCADLPRDPQPQIFIDAQVPLGPQGNSETGTTGSQWQSRPASPQDGTRRDLVRQGLRPQDPRRP